MAESMCSIVKYLLVHRMPEVFGLLSGCKVASSKLARKIPLFYSARRGIGEGGLCGFIMV